MLTLSRNIGQTIVIDGNIRVTIVGINRNQVKMNFEAPKEVRIDREEIHEKRLAGLRDNKKSD